MQRIETGGDGNGKKNPPDESVLEEGPNPLLNYAIETGGGGNGEENPSEPVLEEGPNPLLNYAILAELMSYLPVPDLRRCRLVNSAWKTAATPYLKRNSWLGSHMAFSDYCGGISLLRHDVSSFQYLGDLCFSEQGDRDQELAELGLFGNQNLRVHLPPFLQSSSAKKILLKFLEDYGTNFRNVLFEISIGSFEFLGTVLTTLTTFVTMSVIFREDSVPGVVWNIWASATTATRLRGVASVKRIQFYISVDEDEHYPEVRGSIMANSQYAFLKSLLQAAPNLESLELKGSLRVQMPNWNPDVSSSLRHRQYNQSENLYLRLLKDEGEAICPQLKDLNVADYISPWDMKLILQLDINFRELVLPNLMQYTETVKDVGDFILCLLERHQSSLEVLELQISSETDNNSSISVGFPCLPKLRKLLIRFDSHRQDDFPAIRFDPVNYATQFPALQELTLFYGSVEYGKNPKRFDRRIDFYNQFFPNDGQVCPTLRRLTVEVPHPRRKKSWNLNSYQQYQQFSWRLESMFPNVHNHEEVKTCRAMKRPVVASETRRVTRSMTEF